LVTESEEPDLVMKPTIPAADPDSYVVSLDGWRRTCVVALRRGVRGAAKFEEVIKWGHLVYLANGPVLLIRAEEERVLFGFWRGKRLREIEPRLKPGGKYEMATLELREGDRIAPAVVRRLAKEAAALNLTAGDPTKAASSPAKKETPQAKSRAKVRVPAATTTRATKNAPPKSAPSKSAPRKKAPTKAANPAKGVGLVRRREARQVERRRGGGRYTPVHGPVRPRFPGETRSLRLAPGAV
jgi:hypothetical protein